MTEMLHDESAARLAKTTPPTIEEQAEVLARLEDANYHVFYAQLQARWNVPDAEVMNAYRRLGWAK